MARPAVLAIDQGTTNSKALLVDAAGVVVSRGSAPVAIDVRSGGRVEQDAIQLWEGTCAAIAAALAAAPDDVGTLVGVAVSNQREAVVAWDADGRPTGPVIGWQDARTARWCADLRARQAQDGTDLDARLTGLTGLRLDAMFSAPKLHWLLEHAADPADDVRLGTVDSWLVWQLTGGAVHAVEAGNASRTLLLDLHTLDWSAELLDLFGVPRRNLPQVRASDAGFGICAGVPGLPDGLPILAVLADSHAALYGQGGESAGVAKATFGTGSSVMVPLAELDLEPSGVSTTLAWAQTGPDGTPAPRYAREGIITSSGAALAWAARLLGCAEVTDLIALAERAEVDSTVQLVPALVGLGAPHWDRDARAALLGMTGATDRAEVAAAAVEAVAQQVCDVVEEVERTSAPVSVLRADGGPTASALLMQTQADLLGAPVQVPEAPELSALGAARLAWSAHTGEPPWPVQDRPRTTFEPRIEESERHRRRDAWRSAVATVRGAGGS